jgi:hypothetical protein
MATQKPAPKLKAERIAPQAPEQWPFGRKNYIWFGISMAVMAIGYWSLSSGSTTLAPFLLVVAYCVLVPVAILVKDKPKAEETVISIDAEKQQ